MAYTFASMINTANSNFDTKNINKNLTELSEVVKILQSETNDSKIYNRIMKILQHKEWYTEEQRNDVKEFALKFKFFTIKQKKQISNPKDLENNFYPDREYDNGTPDGMTHDDWDEYCDRQND